MKTLGEEQSQKSPPSAPRDKLVTELATAESDLQRIEAQRTAASARIAALRNELATVDATSRLVAAEPPSGPTPRTPGSKVKPFRQLFRGRPDLYPTRFVSKTGKPGYAPACANKVRAWCLRTPEGRRLVRRANVGSGSSVGSTIKCRPSGSSSDHRDCIVTSIATSY